MSKVKKEREFHHGPREDESLGQSGCHLVRDGMSKRVHLKEIEYVGRREQD